MAITWYRECKSHPIIDIFGSFPGEPWSFTPTKLTGPKEPTTLWNQTSVCDVCGMLIPLEAEVESLHASARGADIGL
jgi:hypothetical protein